MIVEKDIASEIGYFFFHTENKKKPNDLIENVNETCRIINQLKIHKIEYKEGVIYITTERPGVLIGCKGSTLDGITNHLKTCDRIPNFSSIKILEDNIISNLYDFTYILGLDE